MDNSSVIEHYFPKLTEKQKEKFSMLGTLYASWNEKINVISRKDMDNFYVHHVLHSLAIANVAPWELGTEVLDVGTGGGFPGIPLAILFPETSFHLVDSIGKKITIVNDIVKTLNLQNVTAEKARAERLKRKYDFAVSRAVTQMKEFYGWVRHLIKPMSRHATFSNGILYLKGGDVDEEMDALGKPYAVYDIHQFFKEPYFDTKKIIYAPI